MNSSMRRSVLNNEDKRLEDEKKENIAFLKVSLKDDNLGFSGEAEWEALAEHIYVHRYLKDQKSGKMSSWEEAFVSWKESVYNPLFKVIDWWEVKKAFVHYTKGQLFFAVSTHWYYMLEKNPDVSPEDAAVDFAAYYGKGIASWISMSRAAAALRLQQYNV